MMFMEHQSLQITRMTTMVRMVTPNTNITAGSINTTFLGDKSVTGDKIATTGALDNQVLSYDSATDTVIWEDVSNLDNTFENGIVVSGAQSIFNADVQVNADIDLNGDIAISGSITDLTAISADSSFTLSSTDNITLNADSGGDDSTGYVFADTNNFYVGSFTQAAHITGSSIGSIGNALDITADDLTVTGTVTGIDTDDVTEGTNQYFTDARAVSAVEDEATLGLQSVSFDNVEVQASSTDATPSGWTEFGGFDFWSGNTLKAAKKNSTPLMYLREEDDTSVGFMELKVLKRHGDISGMGSSNDLMIHNTTMIDTAGGGARRTSSNYTRLRDITVTGSDTSDYEYDEYKTHLEFIVYDKASGSNEVSHNVFTTSSDGQMFHKKLEIFDKPTNSGNIDLSSVILEYTGQQTGKPDAYLRLFENDTNTTRDIMRFRDDSGTYKCETKVEAYFENTVKFYETIELDQKTAHPTTNLVQGQMYFNTTDEKFYGYTGTTNGWVALN